uniref:CUB and zona pellucida-like domain-containing protein 1 n=2 Tax=Cyprinodon variegatus TaxID=28743 RepID=A0A3Q2GQE7_CYPVA
AAPTTTTAAPTTTTAAPTTTTAAPTTTTAAPTTTTVAPTTTTAAPTTSTAAPTTTTAAPTTTTSFPTTTTAAPTTTTYFPTTTTAPPTTTITDAPTTSTGFSTTTISPVGLYRSSIPPLSKLPLQFSVYVDSYHAPSCLDGDYFPVFLAPTPANRAYLTAFLNQPFEIEVRSKAQYTRINDLIVIGPAGITKEKTSSDAYILKWYPTSDQLNEYFPICFISEARDEFYQVYHSELRCVTVSVGHHEAKVTCNETTISVEVEKTYLVKSNEDILHLNDFTDSSCNLNTLSNSSHLVAVMPLGSCGTLVQEDDDNIIFTNVITSADKSKIVSRQHDVEIAFSCSFPKRTNLTLGYRHKNPYAFDERGFGTFTFQFEFFESQRFRKQVDSSSYPVEVYLKQMIYMQIEATTSIPNTELFVESCRATPYDNPNSRISYTIIENGCVKEETTQIYPSSKSQFRFGLEAFEFIGAHQEVYITCSVLLCETGFPGTRCSQGCIRSDSLNNRRKRDAPAETSSHSISQGPLRLVKTSDTKGSDLSLNLSLNQVLLIGSVLVLGAVIYWKRRPRTEYQLLPTSEQQ